MKIQRESWIDVLRGIAILFVLVDHGFVFFPGTRVDWVGWHTYVSVNWFIFLAAITNTISYGQKKGTFFTRYKSFILPRLRIITAYLFVALFYMIHDLSFAIPLSHILKKTFTFTLSYHFYFIEIIVALYFLFPYLFTLVKHIRHLWPQIILLCLIGLISIKLLPLSAPPWFPVDPVFFSARAYLLPFTAGIIYELWWRKRTLVVWGSVLVVTALEVYLFSSNGLFAIAIPNLKLALYAITTCIFVSYVVRRYLNPLAALSIFLSFLGRHSLFIFLLHFIILKILAGLIAPHFNIVTLIISLILATGISLLAESVYTRISVRLSKIF